MATARWTCGIGRRRSGRGGKTRGASGPVAAPVMAQSVALSLGAHSMSAAILLRLWAGFPALGLVAQGECTTDGTRFRKAGAASAFCPPVASGATSAIEAWPTWSVSDRIVTV